MFAFCIWCHLDVYVTHVFQGRKFHLWNGILIWFVWLISSFVSSWFHCSFVTLMMIALWTFRSFELRSSPSKPLCETWLTLIALDLRHLQEIVETKEGKMHMYDLGLRFSHVGWRPCKRRSGPHPKCPDLSIDLSVILRSLVFGPDLIWWTSQWHPWINSSRTPSQIHAFHQLHLRYRQRSHIPFHHGWSLLHAHRHWNVLLLKPHLQASHSATPPLSHSATPTFNQSLSHSAIQPLSPSVTQPLSHSVTQPLSHSATQLFSQSATQSLND